MWKGKYPLQTFILDERWILILHFRGDVWEWRCLLFAWNSMPGWACLSWSIDSLCLEEFGFPCIMKCMKTSAALSERLWEQLNLKSQCFEEPLQLLTSFVQRAGSWVPSFYDATILFILISFAVGDQAVIILVVDIAVEGYFTRTPIQIVLPCIIHSVYLPSVVLWIVQLIFCRAFHA